MKRIFLLVLIIVLNLEIVQAAEEVQNSKETLLLEDKSYSMKVTFGDEVDLIPVDRNEFTNYKMFESNGQTNLFMELNSAFEQYDSISVITDCWNTTGEDLNYYSGKNLTFYVPYASTNADGVQHVQKFLDDIASHLENSLMKVVYIDTPDGQIYLNQIEQPILPQETETVQEQVVEQEVIEEEDEFVQTEVTTIEKSKMDLNILEIILMPFYGMALLFFICGFIRLIVELIKFIIKFIVENILDIIICFTIALIISLAISYIANYTIGDIKINKPLLCLVIASLMLYKSIKIKAPKEKRE